MSHTSLRTAAIAYALLTATSKAVGIFAIGTDNNFYRFDSASPGSVSQFGMNGAASGIVDIDVHGADGKLYGSTSTGAVSSINSTNGTQAAAYSPSTPYDAPLTAFDHNPAADRVRIVAGNFNYRIVPNVVTAPQPAGVPGTVTPDGTFSFFDSTGMTPRTGITVLGAGYTNPIDNAPSTLLYTLTSDGFLNSHSTPAGAFGNGNAVGIAGLGFTPVGAGFDIASAALGGFGYAYDGTSLRQINLGTGTSVSLGSVGLPVGVSVRSLAVVPEPSTLLLGALAGFGLLRRQRAHG